MTMVNDIVEAEKLLEDLFGKLVVKTDRWCYAETSQLRAVSVPFVRDDGLCDVTLHIQPAMRGVPIEVLDCSVRLIDEEARHEGSLERAGSVLWKALLPEREYRLEVSSQAHDRLNVVSLGRVFPWVRKTFSNCIPNWGSMRVASAPAFFTREPQYFSSPDGAITIKISEKEKDIVINIESREQALEGRKVRLFCEGWQETVEMERLTDEWLGLECRIPRDIRENISDEAVLDAEILDVG